MTGLEPGVPACQHDRGRFREEDGGSRGVLPLQTRAKSVKPSRTKKQHVDKFLHNRLENQTMFLPI